MLFPALSLRSWIFSVSALCLGLLFAIPASSVLAQDSEPSKQEKLMHYSLYFENYKNDDFKSARSDLLWILKNAPGTPDGDDDNYRRAINLYVGLAEQASKESKRKAYLDTAATYLTSATEKMKKQDIEFDPYEWELRKGRFVQQHEGSLPDLEGLNSAASHYRKAFDLAPTEIDPYYIRQVLQVHLQNNELQEALDFANTVEAKRGDNEEVAQLISSIRDKIFGKNPQAKIAYLEKQVEQSPDSTQLLTDLFNAYNQQGNVSEASEIAKRLMKTKPSAETVRQIAQMRLENGRPEAALEAYDRAVKQGAELQAEDHFNRGSAYQKMGQLAKARQEYRTAIEKRKDFGRAYIAIGDLYARAVNNCSGGEMAREDKAAYWAAVDMYQRAKQIDSSISSVANSKIKTYRRVFPTKEDIFYRSDWSRGESYTINKGCYSWIGETTTVRAAPSG